MVYRYEGMVDVLREAEQRIRAATLTAQQGTPWCGSCGSYHPTPRDAAHKAKLRCAANEWVICAKCGNRRSLSTLESRDTFVCRYCLSTDALLPPIRAHVEGCVKALSVPVDLCECGSRDFRPDPPMVQDGNPTAVRLAEIDTRRADGYETASSGNIAESAHLMLNDINYLRSFSVIASPPTKDAKERARGIVWAWADDNFNQVSLQRDGDDVTLFNLPHECDTTDLVGRIAAALEHSSDQAINTEAIAEEIEQVTFEKFIYSRLSERGLMGNDLETVLARIKSNPDNSTLRWSDDVEHYSPLLKTTVWLIAKQSALAYIDETCPRAWFRIMFTEEPIDSTTETVI